MRKLTTKTDNEKIIEYLLQDGEGLKLTKALQDKLDKMDRCHDLIKRYGSRLRVVPVLIKTLSVSKAEAYRIFQDTQDVMGSTMRTSREFWLDILLGFMMDSRDKASIKGDFKSVAAIEKNMASAIEKLAGDNKALPFEKVQPVSVMIGFFPELTKVTLDADWEDQVKELIKPKRKIDRVITDAEILEEDGED